MTSQERDLGFSIRFAPGYSAPPELDLQSDGTFTFEAGEEEETIQIAYQKVYTDADEQERTSDGTMTLRSEKAGEKRG